MQGPSLLAFGGGWNSLSSRAALGPAGWLWEQVAPGTRGGVGGDGGAWLADRLGWGGGTLPRGSGTQGAWGPEGGLRLTSALAPWRVLGTLASQTLGVPPEASRLGQSLRRNTGETERGATLTTLQPQQAHMCEVLPVLPSSLEAGMAPTQQAKAGVLVAP